MIPAREVSRVTRVSEALEYGIVGYGIDEYFEIKYLCMTV